MVIFSTVGATTSESANRCMVLSSFSPSMLLPFSFNILRLVSYLLTNPTGGAVWASSHIANPGVKLYSSLSRICLRSTSNVVIIMPRAAIWVATKAFELNKNFCKISN
ncbi:Uncharacterised protein [Vibrio cholerae]|nr:Uncharacterised protein [Vibrio cholerae]